MVQIAVRPNKCYIGCIIHGCNYLDDDDHFLNRLITMMFSSDTDEGDRKRLKEQRFDFTLLEAVEILKMVGPDSIQEQWTLGCFSKDTLKKNKMSTPPHNWGVPRKIISRRRG